MQLALGCDRAIVATTDSGAKIVKFAHQQKVALLTKNFLDRLQGRLAHERPHDARAIHRQHQDIQGP